MSPEELKAIEERCEKATPGPWVKVKAYDKPKLRYFVAECTDSPGLGIADRDGTYFKESDAEFISHARTDIPKLLAEVRRLQSDCNAFLEGSAEWEYEAKEREITNQQVTTELVELSLENARLMEALEFYANEKNYLNQPERGGSCRLIAPSDEDKGKIAREALEGK